MGPVDGQVPGVVAQTLLLLERQVMLLVDDDQPRPCQRCEDRRASADHDAGLTVARCHPGIQTFAVIQTRMQDHHGDAEASLEAFQSLRGQADFRYQHQHLAACAEAMLDGLQVDLGLAAAGHPVEQPGGEARLCFYSVQCGGLLPIGCQPRLAQQWQGLVGMVMGLADALHQALLFQRFQGVTAQPPLRGQGVGQAVGMLDEDLYGLFLFCRTADGGVLGIGAGQQLPETILAGNGRLALAQQRGQRATQGVAQAVLVVAGSPATQLPHRVGQQRLQVDQLSGALETRRGNLGGIAQGRDHADHLPLAEGHAHPLTRTQVLLSHTAGSAIIEQSSQWRGQGDLQYGSGHSGSLADPAC